MRGAKRGARVDPNGGACPRAGRRPDPGDAGKKIWGRKRHILVDTLGLIVAVAVTAADVTDRDGARDLLADMKATQPFVSRMFGDGGCTGDALALDVYQVNQCRLEIVKRSDVATGFTVLPKRWIVERTFAWLIRNRRLARDVEGRTDVSAIMVKVAMIGLMLRRLARSK